MHYALGQRYIGSSGRKDKLDRMYGHVAVLEIVHFRILMADTQTGLIQRPLTALIHLSTSHEYHRLCCVDYWRVRH